MSNKMDTNLPVGLKIWQEAQKQGFTKIKFARIMDISRQTLDNWINGATHPTVQEVEKASKKLGIVIGTDGSMGPSDIIHKDHYIGMHERVWESIEKVLARDGMTIASLSDAIKNITGNSPTTTP